MAKALLGHVGTSADPRLVEEVRRLRARVGELSVELAQLRALNDTLSVNVTVENDVSLLTKEHALTWG